MFRGCPHIHARHSCTAYSLLQGTAQCVVRQVHPPKSKADVGKVSPTCCSADAAGGKKHMRGSWRSTRCVATHWAWTDIIATTGELCLACRQTDPHTTTLNVEMSCCWHTSSPLPVCCLRLVFQCGLACVAIQSRPGIFLPFPPHSIDCTSVFTCGLCCFLGHGWSSHTILWASTLLACSHTC